MLKPKVYYKEECITAAEINKEKRREYRKQYNEINAEKLREAKKQYDEINKEKIREYRKQYYKINAEKIREYHKNITKEKRREYEQNKPMIKCECCNKDFNFSKLKKHKTTKKYTNTLLNHI